MDTQYEYLREVFKVTEYRDGAVYKTKSRGIEWVSGNAPKGIIFAPLSEDWLKQNNYPMTIRKKCK